MSQAGNTESKSIIARQTPRFIAFQNGTIMDIQLEYTIAGEQRTHVANTLWTFSLAPPPPSAAAAPGAAPPAVSSPFGSNPFLSESTLQFLSESGLRTASSVPANRLFAPPFYAGVSGVFDVEYLGRLLDEWYVGSIRRVCSTSTLSHKVKVFVYDPPVGGNPSTQDYPLEAYRNTEKFSFICPSGLTGLYRNPPQPMALNLSRYAEDESRDRRMTNVTVPFSSSKKTGVSNKNVRFCLTVPCFSTKNTGVSNKREALQRLSFV